MKNKSYLKTGFLYLLFKISSKNTVKETIIVSLIKKYSKDPLKPTLYYVTFVNDKAPEPWMSVKTLKADMDIFIKIWEDCDYKVIINEK